MSDDLKNTGKQDDIRINIHQDHEVSYWCKKFNVPKAVLEVAVKTVGVMAVDVERWLTEEPFC